MDLIENRTNSDADPEVRHKKNGEERSLLYKGSGIMTQHSFAVPLDPVHMKLSAF